MNKQVTIISRAAGIAVNKALAPQNKNFNHDRAQMLINNMHLINQTLMAMAVKMVNKLKSRKEDINTEELTSTLHDIIHLSVMSYAKRAH